MPRMPSGTGNLNKVIVYTINLKVVQRLPWG